MGASGRAGGTAEQLLFTLTLRQADAQGGTVGVLGFDTSSPSASGSVTATAQREGKGGTIRIEGTTRDGVWLTAVYRCPQAPPGRCRRVMGILRGGQYRGRPAVKQAFQGVERGRCLREGAEIIVIAAPARALALR